MLNVNELAPDFYLPDQNGTYHRLSDYRGKKVIVYFYPKDNTAGCTAQACSYKENYPVITEKNAVVIGISKDSVASHKKFETKYELPFILLSDPNLEAIQAYGVWQVKKLYGKESMGVVRSSFVINEGGILTQVNYKANSKTDADSTTATL